MQPSGATHTRKPPENHLNRDTPFVAAIKFRNQLPDLPCDPKMIARVLDAQELSKFHLTEIEKGLRPDVAVSFDPAVLSSLKAERLLVTESAGELHPDDRMIIEGSTGARAQSGSTVSWLMKTRCEIAHSELLAMPYHLINSAAKGNLSPWCMRLSVHMRMTCTVHHVSVLQRILFGTTTLSTECFYVRFGIVLVRAVSHSTSAAHTIAGLATTNTAMCTMNT